VQRRLFAVNYLEACARFWERHHVLMAPAVFDLLPELRGEDGTYDLAAIRLLMELIAAKGREWAVAAWMAGELDGILEIRRTRALLAQANAEAQRLAETVASQQKAIAALTARHETLCLVEGSGWWRLRGRILPILRLAARVRVMSDAAARVRRRVIHSPGAALSRRRARAHPR
jgi:hypothetical protein